MSINLFTESGHWNHENRMIHNELHTAVERLVRDMAERGVSVRDIELAITQAANITACMVRLENRKKSDT